MSHVSRVKGTASAAAAPAPARMDKEKAPDVNGSNSAPPSAPASANPLVQISP